LAPLKPPGKNALKQGGPFLPQRSGLSAPAFNNIYPGLFCRAASKLRRRAETPPPSQPVAALPALCHPALISGPYRCRLNSQAAAKNLPLCAAAIF